MTSPKNPSEQPAPAEAPEHPIAKRMRERFEAKYGALAEVMRACNAWRVTVENYREAYNRHREQPITEEDCDRAEAHMLQTIAALAAPAEAGSAPLVYDSAEYWRARCAAAEASEDRLLTAAAGSAHLVLPEPQNCWYCGARNFESCAKPFDDVACRRVRAGLELALRMCQQCNGSRNQDSAADCIEAIEAVLNAPLSPKQESR